jgi:hypothetical protein
MARSVPFWAGIGASAPSHLLNNVGLRAGCNLPPDVVVFPGMHRGKFVHPAVVCLSSNLSSHDTTQGSWRASPLYTYIGSHGRRVCGGAPSQPPRAGDCAQARVSEPRGRCRGRRHLPALLPGPAMACGRQGKLSSLHEGHSATFQSHFKPVNAARLVPLRPGALTNIACNLLNWLCRFSWASHSGVLHHLPTLRLQEQRA